MVGSWAGSSSSGVVVSPPHAVNSASAATPAKPAYSLERLDSVILNTGFISVILNTGFISFVLSVLPLYVVFKDGPQEVQLPKKSSGSQRFLQGDGGVGCVFGTISTIRHL